MTAAAADTACSPATPALVAPGQPMRTWQVRRSDEVVNQVWRVIANSGPKGIGSADIRTRLNNIDADVLKQHLHELRRKGHARFDSPTGSTRVGCWVATATPPPTELPPMWMRSAAEDEPDPRPSAADLQAQADKLVGAAANVPNSVFALGASVAANLAGFGVDIDAAHMPAEHRQARADAAPPAPAPAPAPEAEPEPEPAAPAAAAAQPLVPLFSLQSDGTLAGTLEDGRCLHLSPMDTRHLFRFLDRLMAIGHGSLTEAAS